MEFITIILVLAAVATLFLTAAHRRRRRSATARSTDEMVPHRLSAPAPAVLSEPEIVPSVYLHSSRWDELLVAGDDGMPPLSVVPYRGEWWLRENTTGLLVGVANRRLSRLGVWTAHVRGIENYQSAVRAGDFQPGMTVDLVREPGNVYDTNAVAVRAHGTEQTAGYINKGMAVRLAKALDRGDELAAISLAGEGVGQNNGSRISVLAASPSIVEHLTRRR